MIWATTLRGDKEASSALFHQIYFLAISRMMSLRLVAALPALGESECIGYFSLNRKSARQGELAKRISFALIFERRSRDISSHRYGAIAHRYFYYSIGGRARLAHALLHAY